MKMMKLIVLVVMIALALFLVLPNLSWAADYGGASSKQNTQSATSLI